MGERTRIVLDTNILVSALGWLKGNPHKILEKVNIGELDLFISREHFGELSRVLDYQKFNFTNEQKMGIKALLSEKATFVSPVDRLGCN